MEVQRQLSSDGRKPFRKGGVMYKTTTNATCKMPLNEISEIVMLGRWLQFKLILTITFVIGLLFSYEENL